MLTKISKNYFIIGRGATDCKQDSEGEERKQEVM
jgi:hypothetical protein